MTFGDAGSICLLSSQRHTRVGKRCSFKPKRRDLIAALFSALDLEAGHLYHFAEYDQSQGGFFVAGSVSFAFGEPSAATQRLNNDQLIA